MGRWDSVLGELRAKRAAQAAAELVGPALSRVEAALLRGGPASVESARQVARTVRALLGELEGRGARVPRAPLREGQGRLGRALRELSSALEQARTRTGLGLELPESGQTFAVARDSAARAALEAEDLEGYAPEESQMPEGKQPVSEFFVLAGVVRPLGVAPPPGGPELGPTPAPVPDVPPKTGVPSHDPAHAVPPSDAEAFLDEIVHTVMAQLPGETVVPGVEAHPGVRVVHVPAVVPERRLPEVQRGLEAAGFRRLRFSRGGTWHSQDGRYQAGPVSLGPASVDFELRRTDVDRVPGADWGLDQAGSPAGGNPASGG